MSNDLSERIAALSPEKRKLLQVMRQEKEAQKRHKYTIPRRESSEPVPLSFAQQRLWFLEQLVPGSAAYHIPVAVRLQGPLDVPVLNRCINEIVQRHEILRTTFTTKDGRPYQVSTPALSLTVPLVDLRPLPADRRETKVVEIAEAEARRPFDLTEGPLFRVVLLQVDTEDHVVLFIMHHIISDNWSVGVVVAELAALYNAFSSGAPSPLPELPVQYADYALWQRTSIEEEGLEEQLAYWKQKLAGPLPDLRLYKPSPSLPGPVSPSRYRFFALPSDLVEAMDEIGRREECTRFMTLLAAFKVLLYCYTGQDDLLVGTPVANRNQVEIEQLIGYFANTLVVRTDLSGTPTFQELLKRIRAVTLEAYEHQDVPFEKLVAMLQPARDATRPPLTPVAFVLQDTTGQALQLPGLEISMLDIHGGAAKLDLMVYVVESAKGNIVATWEYDAGLFNEESVVQMHHHFQRLLQEMVVDPQQPLTSLSLWQELAPHRLSLQPASAEAAAAGPAEALARSNLTKNQLLMWMGQKLDPALPIYHSVSTITISGPVSLPHFQEAFQAFVAHTDAFRLVIREVDGIPQQQVLPDFETPLTYLDLSESPHPEAVYQEWLQERAIRPFDLEKCAFDSVLLKLRDNKFVWYLAQHHIITDKWSVLLVYQRMSALYGMALEGQLAQAEIAYPQFLDYVAYEREYRRSPAGERAAAYWQEKVGRKIDPVHFYGKPPLKESMRAHRISHDWGIEKTEKLKAIATEPDIFTLNLDLSLSLVFITLLSAYLYRISGNRQLAIGTAFQTRPLLAFKETIGLFMEVCPLHITMSEDDTFMTLLQKVKAEMFAVMRHYPYAVANPFGKNFDVFFNYHPHMPYPSKLHHLPVQYEWIHAGYEAESLGFQVDSLEKKFHFHFDFQGDVFDAGQQKIAAGNLLRVLDCFLADRNQRINRFNLLSAVEEQQILVGFNQKQMLYPENRFIHTLFAEQVAKTPDKVACFYEEEALTYKALDEKAEQLAKVILEAQTQS